ncbi:hypothetical protein [Paenibacillus sp. GP183]|jgi:hypothetical protein|uniref:hypothetical protein n=1 Tax=Paenibacillus sp. GP183 TaxID=1882751 RepID=UPI00089616D7|nr:hypothetical protein [Paenibacillus sp. GP183]SEC77970.1 hypothetical protein SAMN05443246_5345 [Paenibacillus sp. GP183]
MEWKDKSSYRDDKERIPCHWVVQLDNVDVSIHRHIHYGKGNWLTSSRYLQIEKKVLKNKDVEAAKNEALTIAKEKIIKKLNELEAALKVMK